MVSESGRIRVPGDLHGIGFVPSSRRAELDRPIRVDDAMLIREAQRGNTAAFEELAHQYDRPILRLTVHLTGSEEEGQDIYHEAFLRAYTHLNRFQFECSFYIWIYRIVSNVCINHLRRRQSREREPITSVSPDGEHDEVLDRDPDHHAGFSQQRNLVGHELHGRIRSSLVVLSPQERMVFELKHYQGLQLRTVADVLNTTEDTIRNTLFRAAHKLRLQPARHI